MFCPSCGKPEQQPESYCRQCGVFLPNLTKVIKRETPPEEHLKANIVLNSMTIIASFTLSILLYAFLGFRTGTHPLIYVTASLLLAIGGWHIQTLIRTLRLKQQWKRRFRPAETEATLNETQREVHPASTGKLLEARDFANAIPSVTETTTRSLAEKLEPKSS